MSRAMPCRECGRTGVTHLVREEDLGLNVVCSTCMVKLYQNAPGTRVLASETLDMIQRERQQRNG